ncbi:MAG: thioredoxin domain-containing protein [Proteobacteria bacterium]|nr:thioredoxin domain-containing protein [Pseudomonadota bacterium]
MTSKYGRWWASGRQAGAAVLVAAAVLHGCDKKPWQGSEGASKQPQATSGQAAAKAGEKNADGTKTAAATAIQGPCGNYAARICKEAGDSSPACRSMTEAAKLLPAQACKLALANMAYSIGVMAEQRKLCVKLVGRLCADLGDQTQTCSMVKDRTKQFTPDRCQSMLGQYDKVLADLKRMEERNQPLAPEQQAKIAAGNAPSFGPKTAKVTVVEFSDFQCPYCSRAVETVHKIREQYPDQVRVVFRQFPLSFHTDANRAAQAALAAHAQGKFWEYHDKLFENQKALDRESLERMAREVGLNLRAFKKALDESTFEAVVNEDLALGKAVSVSGTPSLFVNGVRVTNPYDFAAVSTLIKKKLGQPKQGT